MDKTLQGQVAVVTGGAGAIGRVIVDRLTEDGLTVAVVDRVPLTSDFPRSYAAVSCSTPSAGWVVAMTPAAAMNTR